MVFKSSKGFLDDREFSSWNVAAGYVEFYIMEPLKRIYHYRDMSINGPQMDPLLPQLPPQEITFLRLENLRKYITELMTLIDHSYFKIQDKKHEHYKKDLDDAKTNLKRTIVLIPLITDKKTKVNHVHVVEINDEKFWKLYFSINEIQSKVIDYLYDTELLMPATSKGFDPDELRAKLMEDMSNSG